MRSKRTKFYCQDCGKQYEQCKCAVYQSAFSRGRTETTFYEPTDGANRVQDPRWLPSPSPTIRHGKSGMPGRSVTALSARQQERYDRLNMQHWEEPPRIR